MHNYTNTFGNHFQLKPPDKDLCQIIFEKISVEFAKLCLVYIR